MDDQSKTWKVKASSRELGGVILSIKVHPIHRCHMIL